MIKNQDKNSDLRIAQRRRNYAISALKIQIECLDFAIKELIENTTDNPEKPFLDFEAMDSMLEADAIKELSAQSERLTAVTRNLQGLDILAGTFDPLLEDFKVLG